MLSDNDYSGEDCCIFEHLEPLKMKRIDKSNIYCGFKPSDKIYHYFQIESLTFIKECSICYNNCDETSGWKCYICDKCYCDEHNLKEFNCDC